MCISMLLRAEAWHAILRAALPGTRVRRRDAARGTMIGVLMSATLPARLGEPSRALIVARRLGRVRERFPVVLGTLVSQTLLNILALRVLGIDHVRHRRRLPAAARTRWWSPRSRRSCCSALVLADALRCCAAASRRASRACSRRPPSRARAMVQVRTGLQVFRQPRLGGWAASMQLTAWAIQWLACYVLLVALGPRRARRASAPRPPCCSR